MTIYVERKLPLRRKGGEKKAAKSSAELMEACMTYAWRMYEVCMGYVWGIPLPDPDKSDKSDIRHAWLMEGCLRTFRRLVSAAVTSVLHKLSRDTRRFILFHYFSFPAESPPQQYHNFIMLRGTRWLVKSRFHVNITVSWRRVPQSFPF